MQTIPTVHHCDNESVFEDLMMYRIWQMTLRLMKIVLNLMDYITVFHIDDIDIFCLLNDVVCGSLTKIWS